MASANAEWESLTCQLLCGPLVSVLPARHRARLIREIAVVLVVKALLLVAGFFAFFGPETRTHPTAESIGEHFGIRR